jgi:hypothetical protein
MNNPAGTCKCGCGAKTNVADRTDQALGYVKGEPLNYVRGHSRRRPKWSGPMPLCACGCGSAVVLAATTNAIRGAIAGQPNKFIHGHSSFKTPAELRNQPLPLCLCGCEQPVLTRGSTTLRGHHMKLNAPTTRDEDRGYESLCAIWQGTISPAGYGRYETMENGINPTGTVLRHRQVWITANGVPPDGMDVHHKCEQRDCVRLDHLELRPRSEHLRIHHGVSPEKYTEILAALRTGEESQAAISRRFGVSKSYIWRLRRDL